MHKLLDDYLCNKYPKIFAERNLPMTETCMCWGFPGDGWFHLLDTTCGLIQNRIDNPPWSRKKCLYNKVVEFWIKWVWNRILFPLHIRWRFLCPELKYEKEEISQVVAHQVKEKFGTLRFYYSGGDEEIRGMIRLAEYLSGAICEDCGAMDETIGQTPGWIHTTCPKCLKAGNKLNAAGMKKYKKTQSAELIKIFKQVRKDRADELKKRNARS